ncbi:MAG: extracellular solute-binding protein [Planctomycetes bacterium]|nr:extracellular solute-binding protein [Planctomycetota bacterium]
MVFVRNPWTIGSVKAVVAISFLAFGTCLSIAGCDSASSGSAVKKPAPAANSEKQDQAAQSKPSPISLANAAQDSSAKKPASLGAAPNQTGSSIETHGGDKLTVYCSVDEEIAKPIFDTYKTRTKTDIQVVYDTEAGKTTGLINRIVQESQSGKPRCDVLWSGEVFNTIRLARQGLLEVYDSPFAEDIPDRFKDAEHRWHSTAVRARVLAFESGKITEPEIPIRWADVVGDSSRPIAIANPMFGTTRGHVAAMFALWGKEKARDYLTRLRDGGAQIVGGNSDTVRLAGAGKVDFAFTDSDDCKLARERGMNNLDWVFPTMGDGGTLLIPCSAAILKGTGNQADARRLIDFLISEEVEIMLFESPARHWPVRAHTREVMEIRFPSQTQLTFEQIADAMDESDAAIREILLK